MTTGRIEHVAVECVKVWLMLWGSGGRLAARGCSCDVTMGMRCTVAPGDAHLAIQGRKKIELRLRKGTDLVTFVTAGAQDGIISPSHANRLSTTSITPIHVPRASPSE